MKCQKCEKPATFHITELTGGKPVELHLCEDHAREYLTQSGNEGASPEGLSQVLAQHMAQQLAVGQTAEELAKLDKKECPICGITFHDFRKQGRLGCPHDYSAFQTQLEQLILNIHGELEHTGKSPSRTPAQSVQRTQLIRLRREMKEAVELEQYELASQIRDQIRKIESGEG